MLPDVVVVAAASTSNVCMCAIRASTGSAAARVRRQRGDETGGEQEPPHASVITPGQCINDQGLGVATAARARTQRGTASARAAPGKAAGTSGSGL